MHFTLSTNYPSSQREIATELTINLFPSCILLVLSGLVLKASFHLRILKLSKIAGQFRTGTEGKTELSLSLSLSLSVSLGGINTIRVFTNSPDTASRILDL